MCPGSSSYPFYKVSYYIKWVSTSWKHSIFIKYIFFFVTVKMSKKTRNFEKASAFSEQETNLLLELRERVQEEVGSSDCDQLTNSDRFRYVYSGVQREGIIPDNPPPSPENLTSLDSFLPFFSILFCYEIINICYLRF